ncbi:ankyrin repeat-containing domain protein [Aspergillus fruticulosus]
MSNPTIPTEILLQIGKTITSLRILRALALANRQFCSIFEPILYELDAQCSPSAAITWAAEHGSLEIMQKALNYGANIPVTSKIAAYHEGERRLAYGMRTKYHFDIGKDTPLHPLCLAVQHSHTEIVEFLLDRGCNIDMLDPEGFSLLCLAVIHGRHDLVGMLLSRGAHQANSDGELRTHDHFISEYINRNSAIQIAAWQGDKEIVTLLLCHGPDSARPSAAQLQDAVKCALQQGHRHNLLELVEACPNLDFRFYDCSIKSAYSPLLWAVDKGDTGLATLCLDTGRANANYSPGGGESIPLYRAVLKRDEEMVKILVGPTSRWNRFCALSRSMDYPDGRIAQILLENGAPPDFDDRDRLPPRPSFECDFPGPEIPVTPLIRAVCGGHLKLVRLLVANGADVNVEYNGGRIEGYEGWFLGGPLRLALELGYQKIADFLRGQGAREDVGNATMARFEGFFGEYWGSR